MTKFCNRPKSEPAATIYDALLKHASKFPRDIDEERLVVWRAARDYAQQHGLRVPLMADVLKAERAAIGHTDYGAKFARGVADSILEKVV